MTYSNYIVFQVGTTASVFPASFQYFAISQSYVTYQVNIVAMLV